MVTDLDRVVLGVDAEGIEAHGLKDVIPAHTLVTAVDVGAGEGVDVANVKPLSGWVGNIIRL